MILKSIWSSDSCLNNPYENKLFFSEVRNPKIIQYDSSQFQKSYTKSIEKIKLFFEKILLSVLALHSTCRGKMQNAFLKINNLKKTSSELPNNGITPNILGPVPASTSSVITSNSLKEEVEAKEKVDGVQKSENQILSSFPTTPTSEPVSTSSVIIPSSTTVDAPFNSLKEEADAKGKVDDVQKSEDQTETDLDKLFSKYQLITLPPDADGFYDGVVKKSDGTRSLCFVVPNSSADSMYTVYSPNDDNKNFTVEQILHSDTSIVGYETFKKAEETTETYKILGDSISGNHPIISFKSSYNFIYRRSYFESEVKLKEEYATNPPKDLVQLRNIHQLFLKENSAPKEKWSATAQEVDKYIRDKINLLYQRKPATLPHFFHATGRNDESAFSSILKDGVIRSSATRFHLHGVFVSNYDESESYGPRTFAFPEEFVYKYEGRFFTSIHESLSEHQKHRSLWVCVERSLKISTEILAHVVVEKLEDCPQVKEELAKHKIDVPVITRAASRWITTLIEATGKKYQLPRDWSLLNHEDDDWYAIPENVMPYSAPSNSESGD